eukprot:scaffold34619_cov183-Amphora_coffeaeformis.AAC.12
MDKSSALAHLEGNMNVVALIFCEGGCGLRVDGTDGKYHIVLLPQHCDIPHLSSTFVLMFVVMIEDAV